MNDGTGVFSDGCEPAINGTEINGNIALADRGSCNFTVKVKNAQNAGASAVIVVNDQGDTPITMGGSDPTIVIPSAMVGQSDGDIIKFELPQVNATVRQADTSTSPDRDSDFDSGIISDAGAITAGVGGELNLPPGFDTNFGPLNLFTVPATFPRGNRRFRCAIEDPVSGAVHAEDNAPFEVQ